MATTSAGSKWVTASTIAARIARNYKSLQFDIYDVVEWCAEAELNIGEFEGFKRFNNVALEIIDRKALLPCNVYRLLQVKGKNCAVYNYENDGTFLRFGDNSFTSAPVQNSSPPEKGALVVHIDYLGIPVDPDTGFPLIKEGHEEACYWYCLTKLLFEDYLNGKINEGKWAFINDMYGKYVIKAKSSFRYTSRDDMEKVAMGVLNMIPRLRFPKNGMK